MKPDVWKIIRDTLGTEGKVAYVSDSIWPRITTTLDGDGARHGVIPLALQTSAKEHGFQITAADFKSGRYEVRALELQS